MRDLQNIWKLNMSERSESPCSPPNPICCPDFILCYLNLGIVAQNDQVFISTYLNPRSHHLLLLPIRGRVFSTRRVLEEHHIPPFSRNMQIRINPETCQQAGNWVRFEQDVLMQKSKTLTCIESRFGLVSNGLDSSWIGKKQSREGLNESNLFGLLRLCFPMC